MLLIPSKDFCRLDKDPVAPNWTRTAGLGAPVGAGRSPVGQSFLGLAEEDSMGEPMSLEVGASRRSLMVTAPLGGAERSRLLGGWLSGYALNTKKNWRNKQVRLNFDWHFHRRLVQFQ